MNSIDDSWIGDYNNLSKEKELKELCKDFSKKSSYNLNHVDNIFSTQLESDDSHDRLLDICISAFTPGSKCCDNLGYCFITSEPLKELGVKNFDALILNQSKKHGIFIECKSSISRGEVSDGYGQIQEVKKNKQYLEQKIGNKLNTMEYVFCVLATKVQKLAKQIEAVEINRGINTTTEPVFLIWQVERFIEQTLQLVTRIQISTRQNRYSYQHNDNTLTKELANGIMISELEYIPRLYPSSNPFTQGKYVISKLFKENEVYLQMRKHNIDEKKQDVIKKTITDKKILDFFQNKNNITHYDSNTIGKNLADHFIGESLKLGILKKITPDTYQIELEGKKLETVLNNYEKTYKSQFLDYQIKKKAYQDYRKKHPKIQDFF